MTPDALQAGNTLLKKITDTQNLKNKHLASVKQNFSELNTANQQALASLLSTIHDAAIGALQEELNNLPGTYTAPATNK